MSQRDPENRVWSPGIRRGALVAALALVGCSNEGREDSDDEVATLASSSTTESTIAEERGGLSEVFQAPSNTEDVDLIESEKKKDLLERLFIESPKIEPPQGEYNKIQIEKWRNRYLNKKGTEGAKYNSNLLRFKKKRGWPQTTLEQDLMAGWERLTEGGHLEMVYNICLEEQVPFEIVFLALGESHWNNGVCSNAGACGPWQFTAPTARAYKLIDEQGDHRGDHERSTRAAIRLLKDEYNKTYAWEGKKRLKDANYLDSNRWAWAFWAYNRGPGKVKRTFKQINGNSDLYAQRLSKQGWSETANYVNKLFGIREALKIMYENGELGDYVVPNYQDGYTIETQKSLTEADRMYDQYIEEVRTMDHLQRLIRLQTIKGKYEQDLIKGRHNIIYVDAAIAVINKEMAELRQSEAEELESESTTNGTMAHIEVGRDGEMDLTVMENNEVIDAEIASYRIQPGDTLDKITTWLSSNPNKKAFILELIISLNPEIKDINKIQLGQNIKVPGKYIEVPNVKLSTLVEKYYPGQTESEAVRYIKWLNGRDHDKGGVISPGEIILVPAI